MKTRWKPCKHLISPTKSIRCSEPRAEHPAWSTNLFFPVKNDLRTPYRKWLSSYPTLSFNVKWLGYDDTHNTIERWTKLKDNVNLQKFLTRRNLSRIIPKKFLQKEKFNLSLFQIYALHIITRLTGVSDSSRSILLLL